ncbi:MAG TPA: tetratricopeptide repeat protein [Campylobacterales bacterium]|nr:tetratricopeptide repeat protein [Campylobacterales bacterium]
MRDAKKIIKEQNPLGKKIYKYRDIYKYYNFDKSPYSVLFRYLFFLNSYVSDKKSKLDFNYSKVLQLKSLCLDKNNVVFYNDMSYYLQKAGANKEAIYLLKKIIEKFPNRTVAYYNLGDAYWELGDRTKAVKAYTTYIEQMCHKGLQKKIPKEVLMRVEN